MAELDGKKIGGETNEKNIAELDKNLLGDNITQAQDGFNEKLLDITKINDFYELAKYLGLEENEQMRNLRTTIVDQIRKKENKSEDNSEYINNRIKYEDLLRNSIKGILNENSNIEGKSFRDLDGNLKIIGDLLIAMLHFEGGNIDFFKELMLGDEENDIRCEDGILYNAQSNDESIRSKISHIYYDVMGFERRK